MLGSIALVAGGLVLLIVASDRLVVSAVRLARALGVSAVLIGAVIVGLGTSLPELLVSALAAGDGELDVAMANVIGSNVANVTLVLGIAAVLSPLASRWAILRREGGLMLVSVAVLGVVLIDGQVGRPEGFALLVGLVVALALLVTWSLRDGTEPDLDEESLAGRGLAVESLLALIALVVTVFGANILLDGAFDIGERLGFSATFLGLMLGVGTSLPELATALAAARRSESDLVIGNVLGSNIFNSLAVAGTAGVIGPAVLSDLRVLPVVLMVAIAVLAGVFSTSGETIDRREGAFLFVVFVIFTAVVVT